MNNDETNSDAHDDEIFPVYILDSNTEELVVVALDALITLSDSQVDDASCAALQVIADTLAERFGINHYEVIETIHTDDQGNEEIIYKPRGGVLPQDPTEDE